MRSVFMRFRFSTSSVGFIGVGNMGAGMIQNLAKQYKVLAYDSNPNFTKNIKNMHNITPVVSIKQMTQETDVFILMLPSDKISTSVCEDTNGLFQNSQKNSLILDCSTISPFTAKDLNKSSLKHERVYVDAPVSGGIGAAAAGTLTFMVGSNNESLFQRCNSYLKFMGKNVFNCNAPGSGQVAKICNNMALGIQMVAVSEALNLGNKLGLDPKLLTDIMKVSSSRCWSIDPYHPVPGVNPDMPSSKGFEGGFATELMLKDLLIATSVAQQSGSQVPLGNHTKQIYSQLKEKGLGRKDFAIIYQELSQNKVE